MNKEIMIGLIENGRDSLARTAQAMPEDKLGWKPLDNGRAVLDLLGDAAQVPGMVAKMLESHGEFKPSREAFQQMALERADWTREDALQHLTQNTQRLVGLIRAMPDEQLAQPLHLPMGAGMTLPLGGWIMMTYRTFCSRMGQINYIQTLYGDFESH
jgi:hypothetical protein